MSTYYRTLTGRSKYQVKKGDSLSKIAATLYGKMEIWPELAKKNKIQNPYHIQVGQVLQTPVLNFSTPASSQTLRAVAVAPRPGTKTATGIANANVVPMAKDPCHVEITIGTKEFKKIFGDFANEKIVYRGHCFNAKIKIDGTGKIKRNSVQACKNLGADSTSVEYSQEQSRKLGSYFEELRKMAIEYDYKEEKITLKPTVSMRSNVGNNGWEAGLQGGMPFSFNGNRAPLPTSLKAFFKQNVEFDIGDLHVKLTLTIEMKLEADNSCRDLPRIVVFQRVTQLQPGWSLSWNDIPVEVKVIGGALVIAGAIYLLGGPALILGAMDAIYVALGGAASAGLLSRIAAVR